MQPKTGSSRRKGNLMSQVTLTNTKKRYGDLEVIHGINLKVKEGQFCVFVGPSGCGKSTLLRMIAGLEETTSGQIFIGERDVTKADPAARGVAMVFQSYALYPHMTVAENMGFGLKMTGHSKFEISAKVDEASQILKLEDYLHRKPKSLSGGQRQRVAIGRAIVRGPEVFLFDEPLSNLDAELRVDMRVEIARLHKELGATMIYVTHDQVEAMTLADQIVVLRSGIIEQVGTPMELYENPANKFVAGFIGSPAMNFLRGEINNGDLFVPALSSASIKSNIQLPSGANNVTVGIRPQDLSIAERDGNLRINLHERLGGVNYSYLIAETGERVVVESRGNISSPLGSDVDVHFDSKNLMFFNAENENRIA